MMTADVSPLHAGYAVLVILFVCIGSWYWWLMPQEKQMARALLVSEAKHLWANVCSGAGWLKEAFVNWRAKK